MPTPDMLLELSKLYEISVNEILLGERKTIDNQEQINNISIEVMKDSNKRIKKITKIFVAIISLIVVLFFAYYFFNTYNTIHVFLVSGYNDKISTIDGIAIFSKEKSYIKIGDITTSDNITIDSVQLLFLDKEGKEHIIISSNGLDYTLTSINSYNQYFSYKDINYIKDNSFLKIYYGNKHELIKLVFNEDMSNDNLFPNDNGSNIESSNNNSQDDEIVLFEKYFKNNYKYSKEERQYYNSLKDKNKTINIFYSPETYIITIFEVDKEKNSKMYTYNLNGNELQYEEEIDGKSDSFFVYNYLNKMCLDGKCNQSVIDYFVSNYLNRFK